MAYRFPGSGPRKTVSINMRVTEEFRDRMQGLAYYLDIPYAVLIEQLVDAKRRELLDQGKRPPLRAPEAEPEFSDAQGKKTPRR